MATTAVEMQQAGGTGHGSDGGHADHPPSSTGIDNKKMLMWWFLGSDCVFFASLIATYLIYRNRTQDLGVGPYPNELLDIPYTSVSAGILLLSSFTIVLAVNSIGKGDIRAFRVWTLTTALLGLVFLGGQYFEFTEFYLEGLTLQGNIFGAAFFTLTGLHGTHVAIGVIWLLSLVFVSFRGGISQKDHTNIEVAGLYWHFVDIVWIIIFTLVYLVPYDEGPVAAGEEALRFLQTLPFV